MCVQSVAVCVVWWCVCGRVCVNVKYSVCVWRVRAVCV